MGPPTVGNLAYNRTSIEHTVFIEEDGVYVPYLVLSDDYNRNSTLLLRMYLLDKPRRFNENGSFAAYYAESEIDEFLNSEFRETLTDSIRDLIVPSEITITAKYSLGVTGKETETITREVFLLSSVEVDSPSSRTVPREGESLKYFRPMSRRIARTSDGEVSSWWLRTPNTWYDNVVCGVDINGAVGIGGIGGFGEDYLNGVRPAFCIPSNTKIIKDGERYYIEF